MKLASSIKAGAVRWARKRHVRGERREVQELPPSSAQSRRNM